jgi:hypothetical protein
VLEVATPRADILVADRDARQEAALAQQHHGASRHAEDLADRLVGEQREGVGGWSCGRRRGRCRLRHCEREPCQLADHVAGLEGIEPVGEATELAGEAGQHRGGGPAGGRGVVAQALGAGGGHRSGRGLRDRDDYGEHGWSCRRRLGSVTAGVTASLRRGEGIASRIFVMSQ